MRNGARQTQYADEVALLVAEHPANLRAVAVPDGGIVLVSPPRPPISVLDRLGHEVTPAVASRDERVWQTDLGDGGSDPALQDELTATFPAPAVGTPVLEIVGGNTEWLDLVLGHIARTMGNQLPRYSAMGEQPAGAAWIAQWRERERLDLSVEAFVAGTWRRVNAVPSTGAATLRHVVVPLPGELTATGLLRVRMRAGAGFWRIDQLALSALASSAPAIRRLSPRSATGASGRDERGALADADGRYTTLENKGDALDLRFDVASPREGTAQSLFLLSRGYYELHPTLGSRWSPQLLESLAEERGSLGRLSRDLAREHLRRWQPSEPVSPPRVSGNNRPESRP
jgi:hypothetical protein